LKLTNEQESKFKTFEKAIIKWNKTLNLVSKTQESVLEEHFYNSISATPFVREIIVDMGTGAGFPGIPIAIMEPKKKVFLIEKNTKKSSFLFHATNLLGLKNIKVINSRIEEVDPGSIPSPRDILSRAFGSIQKATTAASKLLSHGDTRLIIMKTSAFFKESTPTESYKITKTQEIGLKGRDKRHFLVTIEEKNKK